MSAVPVGDGQYRPLAGLLPSGDTPPTGAYIGRMGLVTGGESRRIGILTAILLAVIAVSARAQPAASQAAVPAASAASSPPAAPAEEAPVEPPAAESSVVGPAESSTAAAKSQDTMIDFAADVRPILVMHCLKCHNAEMHRGGLRLDTRSGAVRGGDSGQLVLGGTLKTNELYARVASHERSYRMPKNAEALPAAEIETIRRWVQQGSSWPEPVADTGGSYLSYLGPWAARLDRYADEYRYARPYMIGFLILQVLVLVMLRCRAAYRKNRAWTQGVLAPFCRFCDRLRGSEIALLSLLVIGVVVAAFGRAHFLKVQQQLAKITAERDSKASPWAGTVYGYPPKPVRPNQPKQVSGTYYRGNCERNEALFNGGNYLTSIFRVNLCDRGEQPINVGDPIPAEGAYIRCEIERAPGTADQLFSPEGMGSVLFSRQHAESTDKKVDEEPVHLETVAVDHRWVATVPLGKPDKSGGWSGTIYVYTGKYNEGELVGTLHYGIEYQVNVADGKLSPESDLWMDSFGNHAFAPPTPPGMLPYGEWFSPQPLPVITGENSKDPKLLGIDEHVRKGFIKPPSEQPAEPADQPKSDSKPATPDAPAAPPPDQSVEPPADGTSSTSPGDPLRTTLPASSTTTCSASRRTSAALWLT